LDLMQGLYALEELGLGDPVLTSQVAERCAKFNAVDFFKFDPLHTEPGAFVCEDCVCGARLDAESAHCTQCRRPAIRMSAYDVWLEALVFTFHGCRMGIGLGACFFDILRQLSTAFVAAHGKTLAQKDAHYLAYALTHVIYALSNFNERSLPPSLFPPPIRSCLLDRLKFALKKRDPDLAGECLDCLKCIGERGQTLNAAERFLVGSQQADGGWCCEDGVGLFSRYHATLVAVSALIDHSYASSKPVFAAAGRVLPGWFLPPHAYTNSNEAQDGLRCAEGRAPGKRAHLLGDSLCEVDHQHEAARRRAEVARASLPSIERSWPLRAMDKETVALLPVMSRLELRQAVLEDKLRQRVHTIKQQLKADADARFIQCCRAAPSSPVGFPIAAILSGANQDLHSRVHFDDRRCRCDRAVASAPCELGAGAKHVCEAGLALRKGRSALQSCQLQATRGRIMHSAVPRM